MHQLTSPENISRRDIFNIHICVVSANRFIAIFICEWSCHGKIEGQQKGKSCFRRVNSKQRLRSVSTEADCLNPWRFLIDDLLLVIQREDRDAISDVAFFVIGQKSFMFVSSSGAKTSLHGQIPVVKSHDEINTHVKASPPPHVLLARWVGWVECAATPKTIAVELVFRHWLRPFVDTL